MTSRVRSLLFATAFLALAAAAQVRAQTPVWSEEFDGPDIDRGTWTFQTGGSGFGNGELQYYTNRPENVHIEDGSLVIEARRENYLGDKSFTSSRLLTNGRFAFKYGTLEARIKLPNVDYGLWPAFWLMGTSYGAIDWPNAGEIDVMEFGRKDGKDAGVVNRRVSAAGHLEVNDEHVFTSEYSDRPTMMYEDYHLFKLEWTPDFLKVYVDGDMYWMLDISDPIGDDTEEFHEPMFILTNIAVGGWNFIEITNPAQITAAFPARMYIDYIRLYDNGDTELFYGDDSQETGGFGVFTETAPVNNHVQYDVDASLFIWNNLTEVAGTPFEGSEVWSMSAAAGTWWGMGVLSTQFDRNLKNYSDGHMHFHMKTTSTAPFKIGIKTSTSGESWVKFEDGMPSYGLVRDGNWHEVIVPLNVFTNADFSTVSQIFMIAGDPPAGQVQFQIDNMYWTPDVERPTPENGSFGIFTEDVAHKTAGEYVLGADGEFFIWEHTLVTRPQTPYEGTASMSFQSAPGLTWFGAAFTPTIKYNLSAFRFAESKLHLALKTSSTATFRLGMRSGNVNDIDQKWIQFANGSDPYGFVRDGQWHVVEIPMADIIDSVNLTEVGMLFELLGVSGPITNIEFDDVCLLGGGTALPVGAGLPEAHAGDDQVLILPTSSTTLDGSQSTDDGTIVSYLWEQLSGPSTATLTGADAAVATVSGLVQGVYEFKLTITDNDGLPGTDRVRVTVASPAPTADAGPDSDVALPQSSVILAGSGHDADGVIVAYAWSQVSGPTTATLLNADSATATATGLFAGTYVFALTVTDDDDNTGSDEVAVVVTYTPGNIALAKPVTASSSGGNVLLLNGGFEAGIGTAATNWTFARFANGSATAVSERADTEVRTGSYRLRLKVAGAAGSGPAAEARQTTPTGSVVPGLAYDMQVYVRRIGTIGAGVVGQLNVQWLDTDASHGGGVKGQTGFVNIEGGLTETFAVRGFTNIVAPPGADAAAVILRLAGGAFVGSAAELAFDDASLTSQGGAFVPEYAVDGNASTHWSSAAGDPQWLQVDLQGHYDLSQVVLKWAAASSHVYTIDVSDNGADWSTAYSTGTGAGGVETIDVATTGRYLRVSSTEGNTQYGAALNELEVYGVLAAGDVNGDGVVDMDDLTGLDSCLAGPVSEILEACSSADFDHNNVVDLRDFATLQLMFGQ
jgi:beta-glucanase (GH16 family)